MESEEIYLMQKQEALNNALLSDIQLNQLKQLSFEIHNKYMTVKALIVDGKVENIESTIPEELKGYMKEVYKLMDLRIDQIKSFYLR